jgi:hypothetical protein
MMRSYCLSEGIIYTCVHVCGHCKFVSLHTMKEHVEVYYTFPYSYSRHSIKMCGPYTTGRYFPTERVSVAFYHEAVWAIQ